MDGGECGQEGRGIISMKFHNLPKGKFAYREDQRIPQRASENLHRF